MKSRSRRKLAPKGNRSQRSNDLTKGRGKEHPLSNVCDGGTPRFPVKVQAPLLPAYCGLQHENERMC
jgi:hypothetical protein